MEQLLCAIYDNLAGEMLGTPMLFKSETIALRTWDDICKIQNSQVRLHITDHQLMQIGWLNTDTMELKQDRKTIITGTQWMALQPKEA